jgi:hypothetical protein
MEHRSQNRKKVAIDSPVILEGYRGEPFFWRIRPLLSVLLARLTTLIVYTAADNGLILPPNRLKSRMLAFFALGLGW